MYCAFYDLEAELLIQLLKEKDAEVIVFEDNYQGYGTQVSSRGLMHNKFCIDGNNIITGSTNPTYRGFNVNNNNLVVINSKTIANNYLEEYYELQINQELQTLNPKVNLSGTLIENYFCPDDECEEKVLNILRNAKSEIKFMVFSFTSDPIGDLLIKRKDEVKLQGLMESSQFNRYAEFEKLTNAGIDVKAERTGTNLHHKVFIIDKSIVITGSYNPTKSGTERNDENILIIHNKEIAKQYLEEFDKIYSSLD